MPWCTFVTKGISREGHGEPVAPPPQQTFATHGPGPSVMPVTAHISVCGAELTGTAAGRRGPEVSAHRVQPPGVPFQSRAASALGASAKGQTTSVAAAPLRGRRKASRRSTGFQTSGELSEGCWLSFHRIVFLP